MEVKVHKPHRTLLFTSTASTRRENIHFKRLSARQTNCPKSILYQRIRRKKKSQHVEKTEKKFVGPVHLSQLFKDNFSGGEGTLVLYEKKAQDPPPSAKFIINTGDNTPGKSFSLNPSAIIFSSNSGDSTYRTYSQTSISQSTCSFTEDPAFTDSELETVLENVEPPRRENKTSEATQDVSSTDVKRLPPWEQAKLPRSVFLAAQLQEIPEINYSLKYGFKPLHRTQWVPPRYLASSFNVQPNMPCPYEIPSYLREVCHPISDLRHLVKQWLTRDNNTIHMKKPFARFRNHEQKISYIDRDTNSDYDSCCNNSIGEHNSTYMMYLSQSHEAYKQSNYSLSASRRTAATLMY